MGIVINGMTDGENINIMFQVLSGQITKAKNNFSKYVSKIILHFQQQIKLHDFSGME